MAQFHDGAFEVSDRLLEVEERRRHVGSGCPLSTASRPTASVSSAGAQALDAMPV
jgi:hypothetical protein